MFSPNLRKAPLTQYSSPPPKSGTLEGLEPQRAPVRPNLEVLQRAVDLAAGLGRSIRSGAGHRGCRRTPPRVLTSARAGIRPTKRSLLLGLRG